MAVLVADCPRCGSKQMTFDVFGDIPVGQNHGWQVWFEVFCQCRNCRRSTVFVLAQRPEHRKRNFLNGEPLFNLEDSLNSYFWVETFINIKDTGATAPPEFVDDVIANAFREGAVSLVVGCWNAAGAMFRLAIDLATKPLLPAEEADGPNRKVRRDLGLRLKWLFETKQLPSDLHELSSCVREDGNDAAHAGTLTKEDAEDLLDFTTALLKRIFTEPERLRLARERRDRRRQPKDEA